MNEHQQHPCRLPGRPAVTPSVLIYHCPPRRRFSLVVFSKRSKSTQSKPRLFNIVSAINNISPSSFVNVTLSPLLSYTQGICLASSPVCTLTCSCPADESSWPRTSRVGKLHLIALVLCFSPHLFLNEEELLKHTAASSFILLLMTAALMFRSYLQSAFTLWSLVCD